ncbi:MAG: damage-control phosphatase ARMT1 family protein [Candidatus Thorarchaeota archaeon]
MHLEKITIPLVPECSACIVNSLLLLIPMLTEDKDKQFKLFTLAYEHLAEGYKNNIEPAPLSIELYRKLYTETKSFDPYQDIKARSNEAASKALPSVENHVAEFSGFERLHAAIAASIAGNIIDFNTAGHAPNLDELDSIYREILTEGFAIDDSKYLWRSLRSATGKLMYLADNVGETLFDIPLLKYIKELGWELTYVVKGKAMINDATRKDIESTIIPELAEVIDTGAWAHGVPMQWVSKEFLEAVSQSDLIISKGQANVETFPEIQLEMGVETYYITRAKCPHISQALGAEKGDNLVIRRPLPRGVILRTS